MVVVLTVGNSRAPIVFQYIDKHLVDLGYVFLEDKGNT